MQTKTLLPIFVLLIFAGLLASCDSSAPSAPQLTPEERAAQALATLSKLDTMPLDTAIGYTQGWQDDIIADTTTFGGRNIFAFTIPRSDFADLLAATDSTYDFRAYLGYKENPDTQNGENYFELMLVAVAPSGKDVIDATNFIYDFTRPCPDQCDTTSPLCGGCR